MMRRRLGAAIAVCAILLGSSCSRDHRLDNEAVEREILAALFPDQTDVEVSANCPELTDPAPGRQFVCGAQVGDAIIEVPVRLGGTPDALEATVLIEDRFVAVDQVAALLADVFTDEIQIDTTADCGGPILIVAPGDAVACDATDPSGVTRTFDVVIDDAGTLTLTIR